ncbi:MAG: hypothetical protein IT210_13415 [Armatimonadetes bacterium]|nr:hypothetical protein [Armatimonadota bacterium]
MKSYCRRFFLVPAVLLCLLALPAFTQETPAPEMSPVVPAAQPVVLPTAQFEVAVPVLDAGESPGVAVNVSSGSDVPDARLDMVLSREEKAVYSVSRDIDLVAGVTRISIEIDPALMTPGDYDLTGKVTAAGQTAEMPKVTLCRLDIPLEIEAVQKAEQTVQDQIRRSQAKIDPDRFKPEQKPEVLKALRLFEVTARVQAVQVAMARLRSENGQVTPEVVKAREQLPAMREALTALQAEGDRIAAGEKGTGSLEAMIATPGLPALWQPADRKMALLYAGIPVSEATASPVNPDIVARAQAKKSLFDSLTAQGCSVEEDSISGHTGHVIFQGERIERVVVDIGDTGYTLRGPELGMIRAVMDAAVAGKAIREEDIRQIAQELPGPVEVENLDRILNFERTGAAIFAGKQPSEEERQAAEAIASRLGLPVVESITEARKAPGLILVGRPAAEQALLRYRPRMPRKPGQGKLIAIQWDKRTNIIVLGNGPQAQQEAALTLADALEVLPGCELYAGDLDVQPRTLPGATTPWETVGAAVAACMDFIALTGDGAQAGGAEVENTITRRQIRFTALPAAETAGIWDRLLAAGPVKPAATPQETASFTFPARALILAKNDRPDTLLSALKSGNAAAYWQGQFYGSPSAVRLVSLLMQDKKEVETAFWRRLARRAKSL